MPKGTARVSPATPQAPEVSVELAQFSPAPQIVLNINVTIAPKNTPNAAAVAAFVQKIRQALEAPE